MELLFQIIESAIWTGGNQSHAISKMSGCKKKKKKKGETK